MMDRCYHIAGTRCLGRCESVLRRTRSRGGMVEEVLQGRVVGDAKLEYLEVEENSCRSSYQRDFQVSSSMVCILLHRNLVAYCQQVPLLPKAECTLYGTHLVLFKLVVMINFDTTRMASWQRRTSLFSGGRIHACAFESSEDEIVVTCRRERKLTTIPLYPRLLLMP